MYGRDCEVRIGREYYVSGVPSRVDYVEKVKEGPATRCDEIKQFGAILRLLEALNTTTSHCRCIQKS